MQAYLNKFPKLFYTKDNKTTVVTNLLIRIATIKGNIDPAAIYYQYDIQEGDTPEIIAHKYYGDSGYHWVVMLFNDIYDPFYDWPMTYQQFTEFIISKYGSQAAALSTTKQYEKIVSTTDGYSQTTTSNTYIIDLTSYTNLIPSTITKSFPNGTTVKIETSKRLLDAYTHELELNESKRKIKLIKKELIGSVKKQFDMLMGA
jgi:hypothetical protein